MNNVTDFNNHFKNKKVLITGNTGFKGAWLSIYLHYLGAEIYGISRKDSSNDNMYNTCKLHEITTQYFADIADYDSISKVVNEIKPDIVFHLAAQAITLLGYEDPITTFNVNGMGTANILNCFVNYNKTCEIIIITSDKCYQNNEWVWGYRETDTLAGLDPYSASKSVAEIITNSYYHSYFKNSTNIKVATCRAGNVIGGGDWSKHRIVPDCMSDWHQKKSISIRYPNSIRPWNYVLDVLQGYLLTAYNLSSQNINGESFNFGPKQGNDLKVLEMVNILWKYWGKKDFNPIELSEQLAEYNEHQYLKLNIDKALSVLNWSPSVDIYTMLELSVNWYKSYFEGSEDMFNYSLSVVKKFNRNI